MLSFASKQKVRDLLIEIGKQEKQLEVLRQILCEQPEFEPYAAFRRIDRSRRGFLTSGDIMEFLTQNGFHFKEYECEYFIQHYDRDRDGSLIYAEFLPALLPLNNPELRTLATQRRVYDVAYDEYLIYEVEYALGRLISREIIFYIELEDMKVDLMNQYDFTFFDAFTSIDIYETKLINYNLLKNFFKSCGKNVKDEDLIAILRRIDRDDDGRINYEDFLEAVKPHKGIIKSEKLETDYMGDHRKMRSPRRARSPQRYESQLDIKSPLHTKSPLRDNFTSTKQNFKSTVSAKFRANSPRGRSRESQLRATTSGSKSFKDYSPNLQLESNKSIIMRKSSGERRSIGKSSIKFTDPGKDLVRVLREMIHLEREIELAKQDLALRSDFNVFDTFRLFDKKGKGIISVGEVQEAFEDFGILPNKEELYLFIRRFDRDGDGKLRFTDLSDAFNPIQPEYYKLIKSRQPLNGDLSFEIDDVFSNQTRRLIKSLLQIHIENEAAIEALRQRLNKNPKFRVRDQFEILDADKDGYITLYELRVGLDQYDMYATEKELYYIINRFDKNNDEKISYAEFLQELTPKSQKKY